VLNLLWTNNQFRTGLDFAVSEHGNPPENEAAEPGDVKLDDLPATTGVILIIPGRYWHRCTDEITRAIARYQWVLAIKTGDEEDLFDIHKIVHPNIRWWVQTPRTDRDYGDVRKFGVGWTPRFNCPQHSPPDVPVPGHPAHGTHTDVFLSAQNTHPRRFDAFASMNCMPGMQVIQHQTAGFTQGLSPELYMQYMINSKIALAPAGPDTPDTFRLYEALQSHCVPIADDICANTHSYDSRGYWEMIFPDAPFPVLTNWQDAPGIVRREVADYPRNANRIAAWWMRRKRDYIRWLHKDLELLGCTSHEGDDAGSALTVVIPVSPIPSFPDISIIEQTLNSVRWHFDSEIIITFDGVRIEQEHMRADYEEAIRRILWRCDHYWENVTPVIFEHHQHQSGMMQIALHRVKTPLLMYVEQDCPIVIDEPTDWNAICGYILDGHADLIRLHHEALILQVHMYLMHEKDDVFWRTTQWSQRPHIASRTFYENVMQHFSPDAKCFIEDRVATIAPDDPSWKLFIYTPNQNNIKRSYTLDGRAGGPKYDAEQVF
jgi:hypothetical protein